MVDRPMKILFKGKEYSYVEYQHPNPEYGMRKKFIYATEEELEYGDIADMFGTAMDNFIPFMEALIAGQDFDTEFYGYTLGYYPAEDLDNEEIQENEVAISCIYKSQIITKKYFYELCLFLCDSKLTTVAMEDTEFKEKIADFKVALQEKIASA